MKNYYLLPVFLIISFQAAAQYCEIVTELSDRDFDWRQQTFTIYKRGSDNSVQQVTLCNPYHECSSVDQRNTNFLEVVPPDYNEADGWVLINYWFGTPDFPTSEPYLVIYNTHESTLRVFYWIDSYVRTDINQAILNVNFTKVPDIATHVSALLEHQSTPMVSIENYKDQGYVIVVPNHYNQQAEGIWLMTDIPVAYDPCTCEFPSQLRIGGI